MEAPHSLPCQYQQKSPPRPPSTVLVTCGSTESLPDAGHCATHFIYTHPTNLVEILSGRGSYECHWTGGKTEISRGKSPVSGHTGMELQVCDCGILESQYLVTLYICHSALTVTPWCRYCHLHEDMRKRRLGEVDGTCTVLL